jgi:hypothetical protein
MIPFRHIQVQKSRSANAPHQILFGFHRFMQVVFFKENELLMNIYPVSQFQSILRKIR